MRTFEVLTACIIDGDSYLAGEYIFRGSTETLSAEMLHAIDNGKVKELDID